MRLTFIIVAYRSASELPACLESIRADAGSTAKIIVVDNASPDSSGSVAAGHIARPDVVLSDRNIGFGGGCNLGVRHTDADCIFLLNPDARLVPGATSLLTEALASDASLALVAPRVVDPTGESRAASAGAEPTLGANIGHFLAVGRIRGLGRYFRPVYLANGLVRSNPDWVSGAAMLIRRVAFDEVGGFDERIFMYMEDVDLCRRLRELGWRVGYEPQALVEHVMGHSQLTDQPFRWYGAYHAYMVERSGEFHARVASLVAAVGMGLRALAQRRHRPTNSTRMARSAQAAFHFAVSRRSAAVPARQDRPV
jgi:N-acetylglucosaminyl-diphospho-decaprenol L-rhamnosyltransferase